MGNVPADDCKGQRAAYECNSSLRHTSSRGQESLGCICGSHTKEVLAFRAGEEDALGITRNHTKEQHLKLLL